MSCFPPLYCAKMMLKRKLQDLTVCCTYKIDLLHQKAHSVKEFRRQYAVHEEIGRGGFGIVYKAIRLSDNLPVAVKFIEHKHVREWTMTNNHLIPSELCHLETCSNVPGVVRLIDWFASSKGFLIVMERPESCMDVFDLISTYGKLDEAAARAIFVQVVDTVCDMYAKHGLIHRDIKDENLIVDMKTGEVKLVDLGATAPIEKAMKKEFQGTRSYCPPEWFRQLQYLPLEATSWSLGVLLYILVTGQLPFKNEIQICLGRVKFPPYVSKECCQLIKSCLTTACGSRSSLVQIREHPWLNKPITPHTLTFEEVLDATLGRKGSSRMSNREAQQAAEEYRQVNDVILTEEPRHRLKSERDEGCDDTCSESTMITANDGQVPSCSIARLNSRYDNVSASSLADYISMNSAVTDQRGDSVSVATTGLYYSAVDITENEEEYDGAIPELAGPVKSASAYNLAARARKRSLIFKSFDRELDTVLEQGPNEHMPLIMTVSSSSSVDEPTICEDLPSTSSSQEPSESTCHSAAAYQEEMPRLSRHRPLKMMMAPPPLAVFEAKSLLAN